MNRDTTSRLPSCRSTTGSCNWELQALYTQNVLYAKLGELNCSVKKANTSLTGAEKGHLFRLRLQLAHNCQGPSYLVWVLVRHDANKIFHISGERPVACRRDPTAKIRLDEEFSTMDVSLVDWMEDRVSSLLLAMGLENPLASLVRLGTRAAPTTSGLSLTLLFGLSVFLEESLAIALSEHE